MISTNKDAKLKHTFEIYAWSFSINGGYGYDTQTFSSSKIFPFYLPVLSITLSPSTAAQKDIERKLFLLYLHSFDLFFNVLLIYVFI